VRRRYVEIGRRGRQQLRLLQHRQLPARFDDGELHLSHGENALAAQLHAQVVEIVVEPLQSAFQNLSVLDDDGGLAVQQLAQAAAVQTETGSDQAPKRPQQQRQPRRDELEVRLDGQAGGDAAAGDAEDVVEEVELSQLTLAEHPRQGEHGEKRGRAADGDDEAFRPVGPPPGCSIPTLPGEGAFGPMAGPGCVGPGCVGPGWWLGRARRAAGPAARPRRWSTRADGRSAVPGRAGSKALRDGWRLRAARDEEHRHGWRRKPTSCSWVETGRALSGVDGEPAPGGSPSTGRSYKCRL